jgi:hypothetical protein
MTATIRCKLHHNQHFSNVSNIIVPPRKSRHRKGYPVPLKGHMIGTRRTASLNKTPHGLDARKGRRPWPPSRSRHPWGQVFRPSRREGMEPRKEQTGLTLSHILSRYKSTTICPWDRPPWVNRRLLLNSGDGLHPA